MDDKMTRWTTTYFLLVVATLFTAILVMVFPRSPAQAGLNEKVVIGSREAPFVESAIPTWKRYDEETENPEWDAFKKAHPEHYGYWETEIYRRGKRTVNRYYKSDQIERD